MELDVLMGIFLAFLGLAVGSHINVLVLRHGFSQTSSLRSECPQCLVQLSWVDLVPVLSYFALRGKCRTCGSRISPQYPFVEILTGGTFLFLYIFYPPILSVFGVLAFLMLLASAASLIAIVVYDIRHTLIPHSFVIALALFAIIYQSIQSYTFSTWIPLVDGLIGASLLAFFFYAIYLVTRGRGMGIGDAYVAFGIGMLLGFEKGVEAVILGVWSATLVYVLLLALPLLSNATKIRVTMKTELPFAPWLAFGTMLALFTELSPFSLASWFVASVFY